MSNSPTSVVEAIVRKKQLEDPSGSHCSCAAVIVSHPAVIVAVRVSIVGRRAFIAGSRRPFPGVRLSFQSSELSFQRGKSSLQLKSLHRSPEMVIATQKVFIAEQMASITACDSRKRTGNRHSRRKIAIPDERVVGSFEKTPLPEICFR
jgi:hypothetical protein